MIEAVLYNLMIEVPRALAIWSALLVLAMMTLASVLARSDGRPRPPAGSPLMPQFRPANRRQRLAAKAREVTRYAEEVAVAAGRAEQTAQRRREEWLSAQDEVEATWQEFDEADSEVRRLVAAASYPTPRTPRTPAEYADRERYLHRAAMRACGHGELSALVLSDALAHRAGWDPRHHPVEQEVILRRVVRDGRLADHQAAVEREREAWRTAEVAAAAARSLRAEAAVAAAAAEEVRHWLPAAAPTGPTDPTNPAGSSPAGAQGKARTALNRRWRTARAG